MPKKDSKQLVDKIKLKPNKQAIKIALTSSLQNPGYLVLDEDGNEIMSLDSVFIIESNGAWNNYSRSDLITELGKI